MRKTMPPLDEKKKTHFFLFDVFVWFGCVSHGGNREEAPHRRKAAREKWGGKQEKADGMMMKKTQGRG